MFKPWEWSRIFIGEVPLTFFLELIVRSGLVYLFLVCSMRLMGQRMAAQLSRTEMVALVSLAAAVGVPIQTPDRGMLPGLAICIVVVCVERILSGLAVRSGRVEALVNDEMTTLVSDGMLRFDSMKTTRLTRDRVLGRLRSDSIRHLGEVKRAYLEAGGLITVLEQDPPRPGLSILPLSDGEFRDEQRAADAAPVCNNCGRSRKGLRDRDPCPNCRHTDSESPIL